MSREKILLAVLNNQPEKTLLPSTLDFDMPDHTVVVAKFIEMINLIGGKVEVVSKIEDIDLYISANFKATDRLISLIPGLKNHVSFTGAEIPHEFLDTEFAVFEPHFAVAENGAVWITEDQMGHRILPFICQHLGMLVRRQAIVATMHEAYQIIESQEYGFGTFIAGPSKTADIEQSLVLGAHGARSMTIFLL